MKRFLVLSIVFILPIAGLLVFAEYTLRQTPSVLKYKAQWLDSNAEKVECLILGSSHAYWGIDAQSLPCYAFNAASSGQTIDLDAHILQRYEQRMDSLKYVIAPISFFTPLASLSRGVESWRMKSYVLYYDYPVKDAHKYNELTPMNFTTWKRFVDALQGKYDMVVDSLGGGGGGELQWRRKDWNSDKMCKGTAELHEHPLIKEHLDENIAHIDTIIQICKRHNAKVLLVNTPTYKGYRKYLNPTQLQLMNNLCDSFATAHSHVIRLDYFADSTFVDDEFNDPSHLNIHGIKHLTKNIATVIDSLGSIH